MCVCSPIKNLCLSLGSVQGSVCDQHNWLLGKFKKKREGREKRAKLWKLGQKHGGKKNLPDDSPSNNPLRRSVQSVLTFI